MADDHDLLKAYIQRLLAMQDGSQPRVGPADLHALAQEMGLDEAQWQALQAEAEAHFQRGQGFMQYQNWDDAIGELAQAAAVQPFRLELLHTLSDAHLRRWEQQHQAYDQQQAEAYARRCLALDPHHSPSLQLLSTLRTSTLAHPKSGFQTAPAFVLVTLLILALGGVGAIFWVFKGEEGPLAGPPPDSPPPPAAYSLQTPVTWQAGTSGLTFEARHSTVETYKEAYAYTLQGVIPIEGRELSRLTLSVRLLDASGAVAHEWTPEVWATHRPVLRDGDQLPVGVTAFVKGTPLPAIRAVEVSVGELEARPGQGPYTLSPPLELRWEPSRPANVDLQVRLRKRQARSTRGDTAYEAFAFEVENTGQVSLSQLKASLRWYDAQGELLAEHPLWAVATGAPAIRPGEVRVTGGTYAIPAPRAGDDLPFELAITQVDY